jgi:hypothetical protein
MNVVRLTAPDVNPAEEDGDESVSRQKTEFISVQARIRTQFQLRSCLESVYSPGDS